MLCRVKYTQVRVGETFRTGAISHYGGFVAVGERSSWGGRDYHNGGDYLPPEQCLSPEDFLRGIHNSVTPANSRWDRGAVIYRAGVGGPCMDETSVR